MRGDAHPSGDRGPQGSISRVRQDGTREVSVADGQPVFHEAACLVGGATVQGKSGQGRGAGTQAGLEDREEPGPGVYAGAVQAHGNAGPQGIGIDALSIKNGIRTGL